MKLDHMALYAEDLETMKAFYERYFGARANAQYHNPRTGLRTYFLTFDGGARLEIMARPEVTRQPKAPHAAGYVHLAFGTGGKEAVDRLTEQLKRDGYTVVSSPRTTGDGYYESCVLDPEGNQVEIVE